VLRFWFIFITLSTIVLGGLKAIWKLSNVFRMVICRLPPTLKLIVSQIIAVVVYWPLARIAAPSSNAPACLLH